VITRDVTIEGPGASLLTVSGGDNSRVFEVAARVKAATLSGLTISNGVAGTTELGGGILNHGTLAVDGCNLSGNSATYGGGIADDFGGTLTLSACTVSDNSAFEGGGIWNGGTLTFANCTIGSYVDPTTGVTVPGNNSYEGAGIYNQGTAHALNSVLSGNAATDGDWGGGFGGGIYNVGALTVSTCTVSGNSAGNGGGGIYNVGTLTLSNSSFSSNSPDNIEGPYTDGGGNSFS
jgi:predicted outer membrane repeat protein